MNIFQNVGDGPQDDARPQYRCKTNDFNDDCGTMLNTDFALFYTYNVRDQRRLADCDFTAAHLTCPKADTFDTAQEYANVSFSIKFCKISLKTTCKTNFY